MRKNSACNHLSRADFQVSSVWWFFFSASHILSHRAQRAEARWQDSGKQHSQWKSKQSIRTNIWLNWRMLSIFSLSLLAARSLNRIRLKAQEPEIDQHRKQQHASKIFKCFFFGRSCSYSIPLCFFLHFLCSWDISICVHVCRHRCIFSTMYYTCKNWWAINVKTDSINSDNGGRWVTLITKQQKNKHYSNRFVISISISCKAKRLKT